MSEYDEAFAAPAEAPKIDVVGHAERYVIGALLKDTSILRDVQEEVVPRDFSDMRLGDIYRGIVQMVADRAPVNYVTVADKLNSWDVRGIDLVNLSQWADEVTTASSAPYYAKRVREAALARAHAKVGEQLQSGVLSGTDAIEALKSIRDRDAAGVDTARTLRELLDVPESEDAYDWTIPDLLERKDRLMLSAGEGVGKSTFLRQIAVLSAAGIHPIRFSPMEPIRVLVVDAENSERQWRRAVRGLAAEAELRGQRDPRDHMTVECVSVMDITTAEAQGTLHRWVDQAKPDLLILGPLYRVTRGSLNNDDDVAPVLAALDGLRERDLTMLIEVHAGHARSSSGERELRPRGSSALLGWPEFGLGLRKTKGDQGKRAVYELARWRGDRDRRSWPAHLVRGQVWPWEEAGY